MKSVFRIVAMVVTTLSFLMATTVGAENATRWSIEPDGGIAWTDFSEGSVPHNDHLEASGEQVSTVLRYGVTSDGKFTLSRSVVWPMLRTIPNNTHASLTRRFDVDLTSLVSVDGKRLSGEKVERVALNGFLTVTSSFDVGDCRVLQLTRKLFPSTTKPAVFERLTFRNVSGKPLELVTDDYRNTTTTDESNGVNGSYTLLETLSNTGVITLQSGESVAFDYAVQGYSEGKGESELSFDFDAEESARARFIDTMWNELRLETPEPTLDRAFAFAKIRACESVYRTSGGLMHGPGGESYYAAIWANDQAEYANPFFPWIQYATCNESAFNSFRHFARFMNDEYSPIPSSIIAEGIDIWNGAGDRGDAAMIAYGAARYALVRADIEEAKALWPLIEWTLEYCKRKLNAEGVVLSDCDELEWRFPAGDANLCTSSLYYDALLSAQYLGHELGVDKKRLEEYGDEAAALRKNIENYFGANVRGYQTYQYYSGCDKLRSWICIPLVVGIDERVDGTIQALFSDKLWTKDGLLTEEGSATFWDRSTLYALRGVFAVGATELGLEKLRFLSEARLLGEHVPYPIEAWPEGSQRHLSAESALYCRIYTEGLFGLRPTGFHSLRATPRLPKEWNAMALRNIGGFGKKFDLTVERLSNGKLRILVVAKDDDVVEYIVDENVPVEIKL